MLQKRKFHYILLESNALSDGIGGKVHIQGVIRGLSEQLDLSVVGADLDLLPYQEKFFTKENFSDQPNSLAFYRAVLKYIWNIGGNDVFLYRKTLMGIILLFPLLCIKRIKHSKQLHIVEMNGISGDFRGYAPWKSKFLLFINALLVWPFGKIYAVNDNIASRLISTKLVSRKKVIICKNGGFGPQLSIPQPPKTADDVESTLHLVFYGSPQTHYALSELVDAVLSYKKKHSQKKIQLHLIGPRIKSADYSGECVRTPGAMQLAEFVAYIEKLGTNIWGMLPLRFIAGKRDVMPIKMLDYISCGLPIIATYTPTEFEHLQPKLVFAYELENVNSIHQLLDIVSELSTVEILKLRTSVLAMSAKYDWKETMMLLNEIIA